MFKLLKKKNTRTVGNHYELLAENYLKKHGAELVQKNYLSPMGEIDLIMLDHSTLVFIEVRYRTASQFATSIETVSVKKQHKIILTAEYFLVQNKLYQYSACRFDVIGIDKSSSGQLEINWIKNAFME